MDWLSVFRRAPRGGVELVQYLALKKITNHARLSHKKDAWVWSFDVHVGFLVASARCLIDATLLDIDSVS